MINEQVAEEIAKAFAGFRLPRYQDIPDVGLYLEQTVSYLNSYLDPFADACMTGSMVSNYVKKKLVKNPVRKQYGREQISTLFFLAVTKSILSLDNLAVLIGIRDERYEPSAFYDAFCDELEACVQTVLQKGGSELVRQESGIFSEKRGLTADDEGKILRSIITAVIHKAYLSKWLQLYPSHEEK